MWAWLVYLTVTGVKGVTIERIIGRGEVEVQPEGGTDRGGRGFQEREMKE